VSRWWVVAVPWLFMAAAHATTPNERLEQAARRSAPGSYARSWSGEPLYWTVVGAPDGESEALLSEDGALEPFRGGFSLEPFLFVDGARITARDTVRRRSLDRGDLPIPSVVWEHERARLRIRAFATGRAPFVLASYRVENPSAAPARIELWLALRPMQVLPVWQFLNLEPGFAPIRTLRFDGRRVSVNHAATVEPLTRPDAFGAAAPDDTAFVPALEAGVLPAAPAASDPEGFAAGALVWRFALAAGATGEVHVRLPLGAGERLPLPADDGVAALVDSLLEEARERWSALLGRAEIDLPGARDVERTFRTALAHVLINRDGPRLQPGSRNYERSWIRDGALESSALAQLGHADAARAFLAWYAPHQLADGALPCCVDARGADPTPEHDSTGAFLYALGEYARQTHDAAFVRSLWPRVLRAVGHLDELRSRALGDRSADALGGATRGILPESISHEGYAKKPVHSYWDDLFARQGLRDAVFLADGVGDREHATTWARLRDDFSADLIASYAATMRLHSIPHLAGSVELGDFDPTATAVAFELGGEPRDFPEAALHATFARYLDEVAERKRGVMKRDAYAPYELRIAGALVRMGERDAAWDVLALILDGRRPRAISEPQASVAASTPLGATLASGVAERDAARSEAQPSEGDQSLRSERQAQRAARAKPERSGTSWPSEGAGWNQWPEIVWTDERKGQWLGDLPHSWIGATYLHAVRSALVYERASDQALVLAAGVPEAWLENGAAVRVARLSTWWGPLDYEIAHAEGDALRVRVGGGLRVPPGGVVLALPLVAPAVIRELPADVVLRPLKGSSTAEGKQLPLEAGGGPGPKP